MKANQTPTRFAFMAPGGVLSPGALGELARSAQQFGATAIHVTEEQNLALELPDVRMARGFRAGPAAQLFSDPDHGLSISSSVASAGLESGTPWLTESVYLDLFALFSALESSPARAAQRIHICDPRQSLASRYPADWNFLAADIRHHWRLTLYDRHGILQPAPYLLPSYLLAEVVRSAAHLDEPGARIEWIKHQFADSILDATRSSRPPDAPDSIASYEGLQTAPDGSSLWLGVFRAAPGYSPLFLDEISYLCRKHKVGRIYATVWHSLLIKHIPVDSRSEWLRLIARHGLNLRHDSPALYWQVGENYEKIRARIVKALREADAGTAGLSFAVGPRALRSDASVAIVPGGARWTGERFDLFHKKDFLRNQEHWRKFAGNLSARNLVQAVAELRRRFYDQVAVPSHERGEALSGPTTVDGEEPAPRFLNAARDAAALRIHVCPRCFTRYDPRYGDERGGVPVETEFEDLPADYKCQVCEAPRGTFRILAGGASNAPRASSPSGD
ncbi:MAG: rubredoxin [Leptospirales bacterium]|jgi:rubredoxin